MSSSRVEVHLRSQVKKIKLIRQLIKNFSLVFFSEQRANRKLEKVNKLKKTEKKYKILSETVSTFPEEKYKLKNFLIFLS